MDKIEITAQAEHIGTYPISIQPDEDCCQLFVPRHPATRMAEDEAMRCESALPLEDMITAALSNVEVVIQSFPPCAARRDERPSPAAS
jgi:thiamine biosynthesis protein ThiI